MALKHNKKWSRDKILRRIRHLHRNGIVMAPGEVRVKDPALFSAAVSSRYFGSWRQALAEAGLDVDLEYIKHREKLNKDCKWNRDNILRIIEEMDAETIQHAHASQRLIYAAARRHFGTWKNAVSEAGKLHELESVKQERLRSDVRLFVKKHGVSGVTTLDPALYYRAYRMFGSWERAVRETGRTHEK